MCFSCRSRREHLDISKGLLDVLALQKDKYIRYATIPVIGPEFKQYWACFYLLEVASLLWIWTTSCRYNLKLTRPLLTYIKWWGALDLRHTIKFPIVMCLSCQCSHGLTLSQHAYRILLCPMSCVSRLLSHTLLRDWAFADTEHQAVVVINDNRCHLISLPWK